MAWRERCEVLRSDGPLAGDDRRADVLGQVPVSQSYFNFGCGYFPNRDGGCRRGDLSSKCVRGRAGGWTREGESLEGSASGRTEECLIGCPGCAHGGYLQAARGSELVSYRHFQGFCPYPHSMGPRGRKRAVLLGSHCRSRSRHLGQNEAQGHPHAYLVGSNQIQFSF